MAGNKVLIQKRANSAAEAYEHAVRGGLPVAQALEAADAFLQHGLKFSKYDTVFEMVSEWFPEIPSERRKDFCLKILPLAEAVFKKYPIDDRFDISFLSYPYH